MQMEQSKVGKEVKFVKKWKKHFEGLLLTGLHFLVNTVSTSNRLVYGNTNPISSQMSLPYAFSPKLEKHT